MEIEETEKDKEDKRIRRKVMKELATDQDRIWDQSNQSQAIPPETPILKHRKSWE